MGAALARLWAQSGHTIRLSYSRDAARLEAIAREIGPNAVAVAPAEACAAADAVLLATPWDRVNDALTQAGARAGVLDGKTLLDCTNPMAADDVTLAIGLTSSGAEEVARRAPRANLVKVFNTAPAELLRAPTREFQLNGIVATPSMFLCGDHDGAKTQAMRLARDAGFAPVDVGPLACARYLEPLALLVAQLAYEGERSPEVGLKVLER
jgi:8-hydroxy-5-deazaflavin:NADPH oxidoreductase